MKKITIIIAMLFTLAANAGVTDDAINPEVLTAFNNRFSGAQEITWSTGDNYYKAIFIYRGASMSAFFNLKAELIGVTRNIVSTQLPLYLQNSLRTDYPGYWITDLFELSKKQGFSYFITIRNADTKIVLQSAYGNDWEVYKKEDIN